MFPFPAPPLGRKPGCIEVGVPAVATSTKDFHRESVAYCRIRNAKPALMAPITLVSREDTNSPAEKNFMGLAKSLARQHKTPE